MVTHLFTLQPEMGIIITITELLLASGANATLVDGDGQTALDVTMDNSHHDVCQLLLMHTDSEQLPKNFPNQESGRTHQVQHQTEQLQLQQPHCKNELTSLCHLSFICTL